MKKHLQWIAIVLMAAPAAFSAEPLAAANPRWTPIGPPAGPVSARLVLDPASGSRAFALTAAGLLRTQNGGRTWSTVQGGLDGPTRALVVDTSHPGRLYASVESLDNREAIRRSEDFGDHWTVLYRSPGPSVGTPQDLEIDPFSPDTLYWLRSANLFRSRDGGKSWSCVSVGRSCAGSAMIPLSAFALSPVHSGVIYTQSDAGLHVSLDGGASWSLSKLPTNPPSIPGASAKSPLQATPRILPTRTPGQLYLASDLSAYCFLRSDDDGTTWHGYLLDRSCGNPAVDPADPDTVRIAVDTDGGPRLWVSPGGGENGDFTGALPALGSLYDFTAGGGFLLAADQGLFRAAAEAGPWLPANRGFTASVIGAVLATKGALLAAPLVKNNYDLTPPVLPLLRSADGGHTWLTEPSLIDPVALTADPRDPLHLIASAYRFETVSLLHYRVLESRDGGRSWNGVVDPQLEIPLFDSLAIDPFDSRTFYGGTEATGFYRSHDGGRTWQRANAGLPLSTFCTELFCEPNDVTTILADPQVPGRLSIRFRAQVYGSDDGGAHWTFRGPPIPSSANVGFLTRGPAGTLLAITGAFRPADLGRLGILYRSTNGGQSWALAGRLPSPGNASTVHLTAFLATGGGLFAGTDRLGVLWSRNGGKSWSALSAGLPIPAVSSLAADPTDSGKIYAIVPGNGVYAIEVP